MTGPGSGDRLVIDHRYLSDPGGHDRARLAGINTVGLKRAGYGPGEIAALRRAYRILFLGAGPMDARIRAARATGGEAVRRLTAFMGPSDRGVISTPRRAAA